MDIGSRAFPMCHRICWVLCVAHVLCGSLAADPPLDARQHDGSKVEEASGLLCAIVKAAEGTAGAASDVRHPGGRRQPGALNMSGVFVENKQETAVSSPSVLQDGSSLAKEALDMLRGSVETAEGAAYPPSDGREHGGRSAEGAASLSGISVENEQKIVDTPVFLQRGPSRAEKSADLLGASVETAQSTGEEESRQINARRSKVQGALGRRGFRKFFSARQNRKSALSEVPPGQSSESFLPQQRQAVSCATKSFATSRPRWSRGWKTLKRFSSRSKMAARRRAFCRLRRYIVVGFLLFYSLLATAGLFEWSSTSQLVAQQEGFSEACNSSVVHVTESSVIQRSDGYICEEQRLQVELFYRDIRLVSGVTAGVVGLLYNVLGPRCTGVVGQILNIISWSLLACSSSTLRIHSYALMLMASAVAFSVFPIISVRNLIPERPHFMLTVLGTAVSYSGVTPRLMHLLQERSGLRPSTLIMGYVALGLIPSFFIALFLLPTSHPAHATATSTWNSEGLEVAEAIEMTEVGNASLVHLAQELQRPHTVDHGLVETQAAAAGNSLRRSLAWARPQLATFLRSVTRHVREVLSYRFVLIAWYLLAGYVTAEFFGDLNTDSEANELPSLDLTEHLATFFWCTLQGNAVTRGALLRTMVTVSVFGWLMQLIPLLGDGPETASAANNFYLLFRPFFRWHSFTAIERAFGTSASAALAGFATMVSEVLHYIIRLLTDNFLRTPRGRLGIQVGFMFVHSLQFACLYLLHRMTRESDEPHRSGRQENSTILEIPPAEYLQIPPKKRDNDETE